MNIPKSITIHWSGDSTPPLTLSPLQALPLGSLLGPQAALDVRSFLAPPGHHTTHQSDHLELTLAPSFPGTITSPAAGKYPKPPLWRTFKQPAEPSESEGRKAGGATHPSNRTIAQAPGRGTFALALAVHVIAREVEGYDDGFAAGVVRDAWIRAHRLNRLSNPPVGAHWYGLYAGLGREGGVDVPVYAGLVAECGNAVGSMTHAQRDAVLGAYKQIHDVGVIHRAARPQNWLVSDDGGQVSIVEFGRAFIRRRGFGVIPRELDGVEWILDEIEFDRAAAAEVARVKTILGVV